MYTPADLSEKDIDAARALGPEGRLAATVEMNDCARALIANAIRERHPEYDDGQVVRPLVWLLYGEAIVRAVWPDVEPCRP